MLSDVPVYVSVLFIICIVFTLYVLYKASGNSKNLLYILLGWLAVQSALSYNLFYTDNMHLPPPFALLVGPILLGIVLLFITTSGKEFIDGFHLKTLTWLHVVRIPVEFTLLFLYKAGKAPELMTFEGVNFDIISGITAPIVALMAFRNNTVQKKLLIGWNILCLILLFNIVIRGVLSVPTPFQQFAFEQPNVGLLYFPYTLLPGFVVPVVLLSHLISLRKLLIS